MGRVTYVRPFLFTRARQGLKSDLGLLCLFILSFQLHHYVSSHHSYRRSKPSLNVRLSSFSPQLPPLWFAVLMAGHLLDHFVFSSASLSPIAKRAAFAVCASAVVGVFWWFKGVSFGMVGDTQSVHWGLKWRKSWNVCWPHVCRASSSCVLTTSHGRPRSTLRIPHSDSTEGSESSSDRSKFSHVSS